MDDDEEELSLDELRKKLDEYAAFVDRTLHPELQAAVNRREETENEIAEYEELQEKLAVLLARRSSDASDGEGNTHRGRRQPPLEAMVDLGHRMAYCRAVVDDPNTVFVHVGMGFHAEFTLDEAIVFVGKRIAFLQNRVLPAKVEKAKTVAEHMESSLVLLDALGKELRERTLSEAKMN